MSYPFLTFTCLIFVLVTSTVWTQSTDHKAQSGDVVYGRPYRVPSVKVHLTDEETGGPFAERDIKFKYCWGWDVLTKTPETDRIMNTICKEVKGRTEKDGTTVLPTWLFTPSRPLPPAGAEYSEPRFKFAGITVHDEKHNTYLSVFDAKVDLLDKNGEVRRIVRLYPRPKKEDD